MYRSTLLASTAAAVLLCAAPVIAQEQRKTPDQSAPSQADQAPGQQKEQGQKTGQDQAEPKGKGASQGKSQDQPSKGSAQTEPKGKATKGTAEKVTEPKEKATKGTAEKATEPKEKATKGTAAKATEPKEKAAGVEPKEKSATSPKVQISEQQRSNLHQTILKESNVNRVTNVNISINVGTRVPRSTRLAVLPVSVISIVPEYRSYRYFVVNDQICIVDPNSYEIVEIIVVSGQTAQRNDGGSATLVLTEQEQAIILREVDIKSGSTLGLGALTVGTDAPRGIELRVFPATIVEQVPKVRDYKFFAAENRLAIVDPQGAKVRLVIEAKR